MGVYGDGPMSADSAKRLTARLNRISGQISGIQRMVDEGRYCVDILNQIAAVRSALDALGVELLTRHLESCVLGHGSDTAHARTDPMSKEQLVAEVQAVLSRFLR
jgi:CsoR family transcriptional regulator, copper-sensing transcriptional repressor